VFFREQCISKFNKSADKRQDLIPDVCVLLDCILELMATIAHRAPKLKELNMHFILNSGESLLAIHQLPPTHSPFLLSDLEKLSLTLHGNKGEPDLSSHSMQSFPFSPFFARHITSIVGKHCPFLTHLNVKGFCGLKDAILGLVFGELVSSLFPTTPYKWNSVLQNLLAPYQFLSKLCFSLQELNWGSKCQLCSGDSEDSLHHSMLTFTLCHLRKLQKLKTGSPPEYLIEAIKNLPSSRVALARSL